MSLLEVNNLCVKADNKNILNGLNLKIEQGEVHAVMGPNGSGKSTLASVLMGHFGYEVISGAIWFCGQDLLRLKPEERSFCGLFLAFQYPIAVPGLTVEHFLRTAFNAHRDKKGEKTIKPQEFRQYIQPELELLKIKNDFLDRSLNDGFSGGEKKLLEILQLTVLKPKLAILDETDSGLDVDAMKLVAKAVNHLLKTKIAMLVITHYQRILHYIKPTHVHILTAGKIIESGNINLVKKVERAGYRQFEIDNVKE